MDLRKKIITGIVCIGIVLLAAFFLFSKSSPSALFLGTSEKGTPAAGDGRPVTRLSAPPNAVVPERGMSLAANIAVPDTIGSAGPNTSASYRSFSLKSENDALTPDTVIVWERDTVRLDITAADRAYNFVQPDYGFKIFLPKGGTKTVEFSATASGKFIMYCASCGGPQRGPVGYIIVVPRGT